MKSLTLKPRLSEKAYDMSQKSGVYVFVVPSTANKHSVAEAIADQFKVTVETVNIVVSKGKAVRSYRKRSRGVTGTRSTIKKAYVKLKSGDSIAIFEAPEETKADKKSKTKETK